MSGGRYESRISRPSSRKLRSIQPHSPPSGGRAEVAWTSVIRVARLLALAGALVGHRHRSRARLALLLGRELLRHRENIGRGEDSSERERARLEKRHSEALAAFEPAQAYGGTAAAAMSEHRGRG